MVSLGIVGAGNWGKNHVRLALELKDEGRIDEVVVCDTDSERLKPWRGKARTTSRIEQVAAEVDAATVATPADSHFEVARSLLTAGTHVLVEKPMAIRGVDAWALEAIARDRDLVLMPGHIFRYHPGITELRARIARGLFGDIRILATARTAMATPRPDVGVLFSLAIHEADLYPFLLGLEYPLRAHAHAATFDRPEIDVVASLFFGFPRCSAFALASWAGPLGKERRLTLVGTKASAEVDYGNLRAMKVLRSAVDSGPGLRDEPSPDLIPLNGREPLRSEVEDFLKAVESGGHSPVVADAQSGCRAVEIIESLKLTGSFTPPVRT